MFEINYIGGGSSSVVMLNNEVIKVGAISLDDLAQEILSKDLFPDNIHVSSDSLVVLKTSTLLGQPNVPELVDSLDEGNLLTTDIKEIQLRYDELCDKLKVFLQSTQEEFIEAKNKENFLI